MARRPAVIVTSEPGWLPDHVLRQRVARLELPERMVITVYLAGVDIQVIAQQTGRGEVEVARLLRAAEVHLTDMAQG